MITFKNVWYIYPGSQNGIRDISFEIEKGDAVAIVGENGAGKTTMINLLAGLTKLQKGEILLSEDILYRDLGICLQEQCIDWYLNAYQNIYIASALQYNRRKNNMDEVLKLLDLENIRNSAPDQLSGGQQQRIQVARALIGEPKVYILDEPTTSLDAFYSERLFKYLKEKIDEGACALISSHDLSLLENYCNKILFVKNGEVKYFGEMREFLKHYEEADTFHITFEENNPDDIEKLCELGSFRQVGNSVELTTKSGLNIYDFIVKRKIRGIVSIEKKESTLRSVFIDEKNH